MKKVFVSIAALAALTASAFAGEVTGQVQSVDAATRTITLADGTTYTAAEGVSLEGLAAGDNVTVTFEDGTTNATAVTKN
jgi:Cu/Ag efflux protein CusF